MVTSMPSSDSIFRGACVVPTFNGAVDLDRLLKSLRTQDLKLDLLVVDSGSTDGTAELARNNADHFVEISARDFNHGGTRQLMVEKFPDYDFYVFLTQDAYLESDNALRNIVSMFKDVRIGAVCGRQLPHLNANLFAEHARNFNYPPTTIIKSIEDAKAYGIKAAFLSNSFAAYRREALIDVGGFPQHVILAEDMYVAAKMLASGWLIGYCAEARCRHSHNYSLIEEFRRYFDTGVFQARESWISAQLGGTSSEGKKFLLSELQFVGRRNLFLIPAVVARTLAKLIGYKLGGHEKIMPISLKRKLSMHHRYWA